MLFILHQVNCQNAFGAGFAGYLNEVAYTPKLAYHEYMNECIANGSKNLALGTICEVPFINEGCGTDFTIVHVFGQQYYGNSRKTGKCYTIYAKVEQALAEFRRKHPNDEAICPRYMGCGLAGGDWNRYSEILAKYNITPYDDIHITIRDTGYGDESAWSVDYHNSEKRVDGKKTSHRPSNLNTPPVIEIREITDTSAENIIAHEHCYINYDEHVNYIRHRAPISAETYRMAEAYSYALNKLNLTIEDLDRYFVGYEYPLNEAEQAYDTWRRDAINLLVNKFLKASK